MRVKVNDTWYDSTEIAIAVELTLEERKQVSLMPEEMTRYAVYPSRLMTKCQAEEWLSTNSDQQQGEANVYHASLLISSVSTERQHTPVKSLDYTKIVWLQD